MIVAYMGRNWINKAIVSLFAFLNQSIYALVRFFAQTVTNISNVILFSDTTVSNFLDRIYVVLGIYMLFKLAFSLLQSIVDPDKLADKNKGMQKIISRTVIALIMLIMVPTVFEKALLWQGDIVAAIPRIVIGKGSMDVADQGEVLAATALKAFVTPNADCNYSASEEQAAISAMNGYETVSSIGQLVQLGCSSNSKEFAYEFSFFVSIIAGVFLAISLASYCIDVAIRSIKFGLLRLLAPIPIISYIDPSSEKDGAFGNWVKECVSTYLELFIKLAVLYFIIFLLAELSTSSTAWVDTVDDSAINGFTKMFIIVGAFFFMGQAADFLCRILGVKNTNKGAGGGFFKGLAAMAGIGATAAAGISRGVTGARAAGLAANRNGVSGWRKGLSMTKSALAGGAAGLLSGGNAMLHAKPGESSVKKIKDDTDKKNAARLKAGAAGVTTMDRLKNSMQRAVLGTTPADTLQTKYDDLKDRYDEHKTSYDTKNKLLDYTTAEGKKKCATADLKNAFSTDGGRTAKVGNTKFTLKSGESMSYDNYMNAWQSAQARGDSTFEYLGQTLNTNGSEARSIQNEMEKALGDVWYENNRNDGKLIALANDAGIALPKESAGFTKSVKAERDQAEISMIDTSREMREVSLQLKDAKEGARPRVRVNNVPNSVSQTVDAEVDAGSTSVTRNVTANASVDVTNNVTPNFEVRDRIDSFVNDKVPTREEHLNRQADYNSLFFDPANSAYLDAVEAEIDAGSANVTRNVTANANVEVTSNVTSNVTTNANVAEEALLDRAAQEPATLSDSDWDLVDKIEEKRKQQQVDEFLQEQEHIDNLDQFPH